MVTNQEMTDEKEIKNLLESVSKNQHYVELAFVDIETGTSMNYQKVRVVSVGESTVDLHVFLPSASMKLKNIPISSLQKLKLIASKQEIAQKHKVSRWMLMDVAEVIE